MLAHLAPHCTSEMYMILTATKCTSTRQLHYLTKIAENEHPPGLMVGAVEQWSCPHPKFVACGILIGSHTIPTTTSSSCGCSWFGLLGPHRCLRWVHNLTKIAENEHPPGLMVGAVEQWSCPHPKFVASGILIGSHTKPTTTSSSCGWSWFGLLGPLRFLR